MAMFGLGCFWGAERKFWELGDGVYVTAVGYAGGLTPNPTYEEVCSGRTGHNEVVLVVYDPKKISYEQLLKTFWENHDPTQGMRQGDDVGTQYRSGIYVFTPEQRAAAEASKAAYDKALEAEAAWADHHGNPRRAAVLFRRGLSPAISRQESARLLRPRRHRRELPDRDRRGGIMREWRVANSEWAAVFAIRYSPFATLPQCESMSWPDGRYHPGVDLLQPLAVGAVPARAAAVPVSADVSLLRRSLSRWRSKSAP